jgi:hypothetical protein
MDAAMLHPLMIVASDGIPFVDGLAHPRGAGTFSRFLGQYVRCCVGLHSHSGTHALQNGLPSFRSLAVCACVCSAD